MNTVAIKELKNARVLVVGGTGFIGSHITFALAACGVRCIVMSIDDPQQEIDGVIYIGGDLRDEESLRAQVALYSFDYVINVSGYINHAEYFGGGDAVIDVHFNGLQNLLNCLDRKVLKGFVQFGSSDEYGNQPAPQHEGLREEPISPYSCAKTAATHLIQMLHVTEGFPGVIIRPFLVYGPGQGRERFLPHVVQACLSGREFAITGGEQYRDFCYVEDFVIAVLKAMQTPEVFGQVLNIASGAPVTIKEVVNLVIELVGKGNPLWGARAYREKENMSLYADISKAQELLGWNPLTSLRSGLQTTIDYYRENQCH